jgi:hypothetical protein
MYPPPHMTHMYPPPHMTHVYPPPHMKHMYCVRMGETTCMRYKYLNVCMGYKNFLCDTHAVGTRSVCKAHVLLMCC